MRRSAQIALAVCICIAIGLGATVGWAITESALSVDGVEIA